MRCFTAGLVTALLFPLALQAQAPAAADGFIGARQGELTRYGKLLLSVDLGDSRWMHRRLPVCPSFTHHAFAVYERHAGTGTERVLAAYNLDTPPAKSEDRPWEGGIVGVRLGPEWGSAAGRRPDEADLIKVFNRVLADEQHAAGSAAANTQGSQELVACFTALAGEQALASRGQDSDPEDAERHRPVSGSIAPVTSSSPVKRFQVIHFDEHGAITDARVEFDLSPNP